MSVVKHQNLASGSLGKQGFPLHPSLCSGSLGKQGFPLHPSLCSGRWLQLSLAEQLGNIGSEVGRAEKRFNKDQKLYEGAVERAFELFDLTLADSRWKGRLREIARAREVFCDALSGGHEYKSTLKDLEKYFFYFAFFSQN